MNYGTLNKTTFFSWTKLHSITWQVEPKNIIWKTSGNPSMRLRCCTEASQHSGYFFLIVFQLQLLLSENDTCGAVLEKWCPQLRKDQEAFKSSLASFCCKEGEKKGEKCESWCNSKVIFGHLLTQADTACLQRSNNHLLDRSLKDVCFPSDLHRRILSTE